MRVRATILLSSLAIAGLVLWLSESAEDQAEPAAPATSITTLPGAVGIGARLSFTGAAIVAPDGAVVRTLDAYQAAVFVQSWVGEAFYGTANPTEPPPEVVVYRVDVTGTWAGPTGTLAVYYASDGSTVWLSFPYNQTPSSGPTTPPSPSNWFIGPPRAIDAFEGTAQLQDTVGSLRDASTTTAVR